MGTCGLVAMTSASHAEGRQFDPGQVYLPRLRGASVSARKGADQFRPSASALCLLQLCGGVADTQARANAHFSCLRVQSRRGVCCWLSAQLTASLYIRMGMGLCSQWLHVRALAGKLVFGRAAFAWGSCVRATAARAHLRCAAVIDLCRGECERPRLCRWRGDRSAPYRDLARCCLHACLPGRTRMLR